MSASPGKTRHRQPGAPGPSSSGSPSPGAHLRWRPGRRHGRCAWRIHSPPPITRSRAWTPMPSAPPSDSEGRRYGSQGNILIGSGRPSWTNKENHGRPPLDRHILAGREGPWVTATAWTLTAAPLPPADFSGGAGISGHQVGDQDNSSSGRARTQCVGGDDQRGKRSARENFGPNFLEHQLVPYSQALMRRATSTGRTSPAGAGRSATT